MLGALVGIREKTGCLRGALIGSIKCSLFFSKLLKLSLSLWRTSDQIATPRLPQRVSNKHHFFFFLRRAVGGEGELGFKCVNHFNTLMLKDRGPRLFVPKIFSSEEKWYGNGLVGRHPCLQLHYFCYGMFNHVEKQHHHRVT